MVVAKSRVKTEYVCSECGNSQMKWMGRCPDCGEWNTLQEFVVRSDEPTRSPMPTSGGATGATPVALSEISVDGAPRLPLKMAELNRVLGGGVTPGAGVLLGGDPGIGKSTLLLQMAAEVAQKYGKVLYVSAEESAQQIGRRARRLGIEEARLMVMSEIVVEKILDEIERSRPVLVIVDSIQAIYANSGTSSAGTVSQVRDCAAMLLRMAKQYDIPLFLVGHVTKDGSIAGPRVLEHMVDTVLQLEGERFHAYRLLRSIKNRFGSTNEVGIFEMGEQGMDEVRNPSELFLAERLPNAAGSAIVVSMEGTRPILVEVQALSSHSAFSQPRRTGNGVDFNRLLLLAAVLSKRVGFDLSDQDIFVNIVGGMRISEPAADLAIALAIASSYRNRPVAADLAVVGEVGLSGELRSVGQLSRRLREAASLGFRRALVPRSTLNRSGGEAQPKEIEPLGVRTLGEALEIALVK
ncbi:MAG: DNA repair protein RadA [Caldilineaceae bacterium]|nr:DNA repair protein RadA [Caldilineaceae bacterium]